MIYILLLDFAYDENSQSLDISLINKCIVKTTETEKKVYTHDTVEKTHLYILFTTKKEVKQCMQRPC